MSAVAAILAVALISAPLPNSGEALASSPSPIKINGPAHFKVTGQVAGAKGKETASSAAAVHRYKAKASNTTYGVISDGSGEEAIANLSHVNDESASRRTMWAAGPDFVELTWPNASASGTYEISRDGVTLGSTSNTSAHISGESPAGRHNYAVSTDVSKPEAEWTDEERSTYQTSGKTPTEGATWGFQISTPSTATDADLAATASTLATSYDDQVTWYFQFQAFIPGEYVTAPAGCTYTGDGYHYLGDNRGFEEPGTSRLNLENVGVAWDEDYDPQAAWDPDMAVGTTHVTTADGDYVDEATAVPEWSVDVTHLDQDSAYLVTHIRGTNPFCWIGAIDGSADLYLSVMEHSKSLEATV